MKSRLTQRVKSFLFLPLLTLFLTSCAQNSLLNNIQNHISNTKKTFYSNKFGSLTDIMVDKSEVKLKKYITNEDIVLVPDFVNLNKLKNRSKLGFLLCDYLKNSLSRKNITVRQVELSKEFHFGVNGFNLLTRIQKDMSRKYVKSQYAIVGTYSITTQSLITFIKLIDINNGNILSSVSANMPVTEEVLNLEYKKAKVKPYVATPLVL